MKKILKNLIVKTAHFLQKLQPSSKDRKHILLICNGPLMARYLRHIVDICKDDQRLNVSYVEHLVSTERSDASTQISQMLTKQRVTSKRAALKKWDLMVLADHTMPNLIDSQDCPTIYMGHGLETGKIVNNESYTLGLHATNKNGEYRYSSYLAPSKHVLKGHAILNKQFAKFGFVAGDPVFDELLQHQEKRSIIRRKLGIDENKITVYAMGTWGPNGLWQKMGDKMLEKMRDLKCEYNFILGAHPNDFRPRNDGSRSWGLHLQKQKEFIVVDPTNPTSDWKDYLTACDVIISDHTSLALYGALQSRPLVFINVDKKLNEEGSLPSRLMTVSPKLKNDASNLDSAISDSIKNYPKHERDAINEDINSYPGKSHDRIRTHIYETLKIPLPER